MNEKTTSIPPVVKCRCGELCSRAGTIDEPCWGQVLPASWEQIEGDDDIAIHACRGHADHVGSDGEEPYKQFSV